MKGYDVILILGVSGCIFLPLLKLFSRKKIVVNIDGLEHRRDKWGKAARWFLRFSESIAVRWADVVVADNKGIQDYVTETYGKKSELIAYGGDHVVRDMSDNQQNEILTKYGLKKGDYAISVCRIEPENNCHVSLEAFSKTDKNFVFIGNWNRSEYGKNLKEKYSAYKNIKILDPIYELDTFYALRSNAGYYIHGHSAGGTNPSLVEAMFFACPIIAYDVVYNRETTNNKAYYFSKSDDIIALLDNVAMDGAVMKVIAEEQYTWRTIAKQYEALF
jgi:glycosyltransferase involved in cell wall biosynthesis